MRPEDFPMADDSMCPIAMAAGDPDWYWTPVRRRIAQHLASGRTIPETAQLVGGESAAIRALIKVPEFAEEVLRLVKEINAECWQYEVAFKVNRMKRIDQRLKDLERLTRDDALLIYDGGKEQYVPRLDARILAEERKLLELAGKEMGEYGMPKAVEEVFAKHIIGQGLTDDDV